MHDSCNYNNTRELNIKNSYDSYSENRAVFKFSGSSKESNSKNISNNRRNIIGNDKQHLNNKKYRNNKQQNRGNVRSSGNKLLGLDDRRL